MPPRIFMTGVTGYIGGDALFVLHSQYPDYHYSLLIRSPEGAELVKKAYPGARIVLGTIDDHALLRREAAAADIVIHTADSSDHEASARAIAAGLSDSHSANNPGFWIHICGTGMLTWWDRTHDRYGQSPLLEQTYGDMSDIEKIINFPKSAIHRPVDEIVLGANSPAVRTAIVSPPTIYGPGHGPVSTRSQQIPNMAAATLRLGYAPIIAPGLAEWDNVHIEDVSWLILTLLESSLDPSRKDDPDIFGPKGYFFLQSGRHNWADVARMIAEESCRQGLLAKAVTQSVSVDQDGIEKGWGTNSSCSAQRALRMFGWTPIGSKLSDDIPRIVASEAERLGVMKY